MRHEIASSSGNCRVLYFTSVLHVSDSNTCHQLHQENAVITRRYDMIPRKPAVSDYDYVDVAKMPVLSTFKEAVVEYIAGYVVKSTEKSIATYLVRLFYRSSQCRDLSKPRSKWRRHYLPVGIKGWGAESCPALCSASVYPQRQVAGKITRGPQMWTWNISNNSSRLSEDSANYYVI